jgi:stearoyl-CoA desaturase (delta-9 desaturase)
MRLVHTVPRWVGSRASRLWRWLSNDASLVDQTPSTARERVDWLRASPFLAMHLACLGVVVVGTSWAALVTCLALYLSRMFFVTAFYHRYFSHRAFQTSRTAQWIMAVLGCTAGQRGPLWWAGHHRLHHQHSDTVDDPHSPRYRGLWFSHTLWFLTPASFPVPADRVRDWARFPELVWLNRFYWVPFVLLAVAVYALGAWAESAHPYLGTNGPQMLIWGFFVSTVLLYHATYTINSLAHRFGTRRYATADDSRNNWLLALLTLGEGWHNNHHHYPAAARQGFRWWELDISYWGLRVLAWLGFVRALRPVPEGVRVTDRRPRETG